MSLVLEHENAAYVTDQRVVEVTRELARQLREAPFSVELLVLREAAIDESDLDGLTVRRFDAAADAQYYEVKNAGAREARGHVIVLADCDVTPLEDWLVNLVRPFEDPRTDATVGITTIRPVTTATDKAFAAATWFSAHERDARLQILANNVAFRPSVFLPGGFPDVGCRYRGPDRDLTRTWAANGVRMQVATDALARHPAPEHPVRRALWDGHDQQIEQRATGATFGPYLARVVLHQLLVGSVRILQNRRAVGLSRAQLPVALASNGREAAARGLGFTLARFAHDAMHRRVPR